MQNFTVRKLIIAIIFLSLNTITHAEDPTTPKPIQASAVTTQDESKSALPAPPNTNSNLPSTSLNLDAINCEYKIEPTAEVNNNIVIIWSEKAAMQSFNYSSANIDNKLQELKNCFTEQGYTSYTDALSKSGNVEAIKSQQLNVSSIVDGKSKINKIEDNKWQVKVPLQVVYQNNKEKLTQLLFIDMLVARKISGELGILQIIAAPRDKITEKI